MHKDIGDEQLRRSVLILWARKYLTMKGMKGLKNKNFMLFMLFMVNPYYVLHLI
jgi:hypothetical protein